MIEPLISQNFLSSSINLSITSYKKKTHFGAATFGKNYKTYVIHRPSFLIFKDNSFINKGHTESSKNSTVIHPVVFQLTLL